MWHTHVRPFLAVLGINLISSIMVSWFLSWFADWMVPVVSMQLAFSFVAAQETIGWLVRWIRAWQTGISYRPR